MDNKNIILGAVIGAVVSVVAILAVALFLGIGGSNGPLAGGSGRAYNSDTAVRSLTLATSTEADASNGTNDTINGLIEGSCNISQTTPGSHAATTTKEYYCAATGARSGDTVLIALPSGAGYLFGGFDAVASYATSSNFIAMQIANNTGAATSSAAQATTSVRYLIVR